MEKKPTLGKGLSALFTENKVDLSSISGEELNKQVNQSLEIPVEKISVNPNQPREEFDEARLNELADSIKRNGIIQPVTVRKIPSGYELISGERRLRASKKAGLKSIPAYVYSLKEENESLLVELALIENIQREDLNPIELSNTYQRMIDELGMTQEKIAERVSKQRSTIGNFLRLQKLQPEVKVSLKKNEISEGHARMLLRIEDRRKQIEMLGRIIREKLSVRQLEDITKSEIHPKPQKKKIKTNQSFNPYFDKLTDKLRLFFGTRVKINSKTNKSGEIIIEYYSDDDLERILEKCDN